MTPITIYHNPQCSKSRKALELIRLQGIAPVIVSYLSNPMDLKELKALHQLLRLPVREMIRSNETAYTELNLDDRQKDDDTILALVARYPDLLQRPIVVQGNRAVIARPPEEVLKLLSSSEF